MFLRARLPDGGACAAVLPWSSMTQGRVTELSRLLRGDTETIETSPRTSLPATGGPPQYIHAHGPSNRTLASYYRRCRDTSRPKIRGIKIPDTWASGKAPDPRSSVGTHPKKCTPKNGEPQCRGPATRGDLSNECVLRRGTARRRFGGGWGRVKPLRSREEERLSRTSNPCRQ